MSDDRFTELLAIWKQDSRRGTSQAKTRQWKRIASTLGVSIDEAKAFGLRLLASGDETGTPLKSDNSLVATAGPSSDASFEHETPYWHDPARDVYVVFLPHLPKPLALPAHVWGSIKAAYSNWDGSPATVEQVARTHGLTRRTVVAILRTFAHTHTGSPWTREHTEATDVDDLVTDLVLAKEEKVLRKAEQANWERTKKKAEAFDQLRLGHLSALDEWLSKPHPKKLRPTRSTPNPSGDTMVVVGLTDLHMGAPNHDAPRAVWSALDGLMATLAPRISGNRLHQWILPIGGDNMHYDTVGYTTTRGTKMETSEARAREVVVEYMDLYAEIIQDLAQSAPVHCVPVAGNHDRMMSYATFAAMRLAFSTHHGVTFSESLSDIQVVTFGRTLVALHHGDLHKPKDMAGIIPRDYGKEWGETSSRYCLMGHYHTPGTFGTKSGLECIYMPSLAPSDEWHTDMGWQNQPSLSAYEFDDRDGLIAIHKIRS